MSAICSASSARPTAPRPSPGPESSASSPDAPAGPYFSKVCFSKIYFSIMPNGLGKPSHVFDREREWQALADFAADPRPEATLGIVSGRRRQGKTYLLRSLAAATGGFFFEAAEATEAESLRMFGAT